MYTVYPKMADNLPIYIHHDYSSFCGLCPKRSILKSRYQNGYLPTLPEFSLKKITIHCWKWTFIGLLVT